MSGIIQFLGRLHPLVVHLPIGILLLACLFILQARRDRASKLQPAINIILFIGMVTAFLSAISGFILSRSGDYNLDSVELHQWMGISVTIVSFFTWFFYRRESWIRFQAPMAVLLLLLIFITGHLGGSLTHGADFLFGPGKNAEDSSVVIKRKPIADMQKAVVYSDLVKYVLAEKCYSCHGPNKQKGKLRMDDSLLLMKGGKGGVVLVPGKPGESELYKRIQLPAEAEHHMPPKEKPQLTEGEINLIHWWINGGAGFTAEVKDLAQEEKIKTYLAALQISGGDNGPPDVPESAIEEADRNAMDKARARGIILLPVSRTSNYLMADFISVNRLTQGDIDLLLPLKKQLVWLNLGNSAVNDSALKSLSGLNNLTKLRIDHSAVTDKGLANLTSLSKLQSINLVGDSVTVKGILSLKEIKSLRRIYVYQTKLLSGDWQLLYAAFPHAAIDTGGYFVPLLTTDTSLVKPPVIKK